MIKVVLSVPVKNLKGDEVKDESGLPLLSSKVLANELSIKAEGIEPIKAMDWAFKLYNEGFIETDKHDFDKLYNFVKSGRNNLTNLAKHYILLEMDKCKKDSEKEGEK